MKKVLIAAICGMLALSLAACSNIPDEPATTGIESYTYKNLYGATVPVAENIEDFPGITQPVKHVATTHGIEFETRSYYVYGNTVASVTKIEIDDLSGPQASIYASLELKIIGKGLEKEMKIGYNAYDSEGKLLKSNFVESNIKGKKDNSSAAAVLTVPKDTAKVVFLDYNIE